MVTLSVLSLKRIFGYNEQCKGGCNRGGKWAVKGQGVRQIASREQEQQWVPSLIIYKVMARERLKITGAAHVVWLYQLRLEFDCLWPRPDLD